MSSGRKANVARIVPMQIAPAEPDAWQHQAGYLFQNIPHSCFRPRDLTSPPVLGMRRAHLFRLTYSKMFELFITDMTRIRIVQKILSDVSVSRQIIIGWHDLDQHFRYGVAYVQTPGAYYPIVRWSRGKPGSELGTLYCSRCLALVTPRCRRKRTARLLQGRVV